MSTAQRALPATHGSRTQTITPTPALEAGTEAGPSRPSAVVPPTGVLKLRGGTGRKAKVVWSEEVVDNEGMGRKKSKSESWRQVSSGWARNGQSTGQERGRVTLWRSGDTVREELIP